MRTIFAIAMLLASLSVRAQVFYEYTGNPYTTFQDLALPAGSYDASMRVTGIFELAAPIAANTPLTDFSSSIISFSFSDGRSTLTQSAPELTAIFYLQTDALGRIDVWDIFVEHAHAPSLTDTEILIGTQNDLVGAVGLSGVSDRGQFAVCEPNNIPRGLCINLADIASVDALPGIWSAPVVVPPVTPVSEPSMISLMTLGLGWLALAAKRRGATRYRGTCAACPTGSGA